MYESREKESEPCRQKQDGRQTGVITDENIYQRYLRGETNAADLLVEKYADMLIFYINGYIDVYKRQWLHFTMYFHRLLI